MEIPTMTRRCACCGKPFAPRPQVPVNGGDQWGVRGEGNDRLTSIHDTQQQAIDHARGIAINQQSEMFIQGRDGQIRERNSYGHDPFPPKG
jgi:hypothetical protein